MDTKITKRLIICAQNRGSIGKSTTLTLLGEFLTTHSLPWQGFDLDPDHRSFSRNFPQEVEFSSLGEEPQGDLIKLLRKTGDEPLTLIDPRAHQGDLLVKALKVVQFPAIFAEQGGRITALLFPADDLEVMTDLDRVVTTLQDQVDYLVIKNRARALKTKMYDGSELVRGQLKPASSGHFKTSH